MRKLFLILLFLYPMFLIAQTNLGDVSLNTKDNNLVIVLKLNQEINTIQIINNENNVVVEVNKTRGSNIVDIPISNMENGTYFVRLEQNELIEIHRIIIKNN